MLIIGADFALDHNPDAAVAIGGGPDRRTLSHAGWARCGSAEMGRALDGGVADKYQNGSLEAGRNGRLE